jgi:hypothetical protein
VVPSLLSWRLRKKASLMTENQESTPSRLPDQPYATRQKLTVVPDDEAGKLQVAARANGVSWPELPLGGGLAGIVGGAAAMALYLAIAEARKEGLDVLPVTESDTTDLEFSVGHPRAGVVYIGNPAAPPAYYTAADFHRRTFEHKFNEVLELLMGLGANYIKVEWESGFDRRIAAELDVPIQGVASSTKAGASSGADSALLFEANLSPRHEPLVPSGLVWYPREPLWQRVAAGRLERGLKDFHLSVRYTDDFGIDAAFATKVGKSKLGLGGDFKRHEATVWRISGTFDEPTEGRRPIARSAGAKTPPAQRRQAGRRNRQT